MSATTDGATQETGDDAVDDRARELIELSMVSDPSSDWRDLLRTLGWSRCLWVQADSHR